MIRRPPRCTLFPSTPLFRSGVVGADEHQVQPTEPGGDRRQLDVARLAHRTGVERRDLAQVVVGGADEPGGVRDLRSEEHTSELQSRQYLVCRLLLEKKKFQHGLCLRSTGMTSGGCEVLGL